MLGDANGLWVAGVNVNNRRYEIATALIANCQDELQTLITLLEKNSKTYGMEINLKNGGNGCIEEADMRGASM